MVPVVHRSGGPWFDIVERGKYGLGYEDVDGAVEAVKHALDEYENLRERAVKRVMGFRKENFVERFRRIVEGYDGGGKA